MHNPQQRRQAFTRAVNTYAMAWSQLARKRVRHDVVAEHKKRKVVAQVLILAGSPSVPYGHGTVFSTIK